MELEKQNIIYFADPEIVYKAQNSKDLYLVDKILKFNFQGSGNRVYIETKVILGKDFKAIITGNNNSIVVYIGCILSGGTINFKGDKNICNFGLDTKVSNGTFIFYGNDNTLYIKKKCIFMSGAKLIFSRNNNYAYIGPKSIFYPTARLVFSGNNALAFFCGNQNIRQSITLTMSNIFFHGGGSKNMGTADHLYQALESKNVLIGADTMFAGGLLIRTSDTHLIYDNKTFKRINTGKSIIIGDHVWIGQECKVFKGARIEDGCMVGACSIVTKHIKSNSICAGSPAVIKKENIIWDWEQPANFTRYELEDYETYKGTQTCKFLSIGFEKLMEIDEIDHELCSKEKVDIIKKIIKA